MNLFGPNEDVRALFASLQAVLGPGEIVDDNIGGSACYHVYGQHRGRPIHVFITTTGGIPLAVRFGASLGGRPITLLLNHRKNTTILAVPEVRTGYSEFDELFLLNGFPAEVLRDALDTPTRTWVIEQFTSREPTLTTERGEITLDVVVHVRFKHLARPMPPAEVVYWLDALLPIADRLVLAFDQHHQAISQAHGPAAAKQWVQANAGAMEARAARRSHLRTLLYVLFLGVPLGVTFIVAAIIIALTFWR